MPWRDIARPSIASSARPRLGECAVRALSIGLNNWVFGAVLGRVRLGPQSCDPPQENALDFEEVGIIGTDFLSLF